MLTPSFPNAVKRSFYVETEGWDADVKVDYDTKRNPFRIYRIQSAANFFKKYGLRVVDLKVYTTRKGHHLRIWLDRRIGPYRALRIQSILNDDPQRQRFNKIRVRKKMAGWNVLFTQKWIGKTLHWKETEDSEATKLVWTKLGEERQEATLTKKVKKEFEDNL